MGDFLYWMHKHSERISWFIAGFLTAQGLEQVARGDYNSALLSFIIAGINVFLSLRS